MQSAMRLDVIEEGEVFGEVVGNGGDGEIGGVLGPELSLGGVRYGVRRRH